MPLPDTHGPHGRTTSFPVRRIEPEHFGPLTDRPLADHAAAGAAAADELFPGASRHLGRRHQDRRRAQWDAARPLAERLLRSDEHILYVTHAMQVPPVLHSMALGAMTPSYHQVVLIFTESRIIEVLLGVRGKTAGSRLRSFPLSGISALAMRMTRLNLKPARGKKQSWRVPLKGDRTLLKGLLERLAPRLLTSGATAAETLPLWHCPSCGAVMAEGAASCDGCRTAFRSPRLATILAIAFPGAGLLYAGHPWLAAADFLGEVFLYFVFLMLMLEADTAALPGTLALGAFFFIMTKLESIHLSRILIARTKPENTPGAPRFRRLAAVGGVASALLVGITFPLMGSGRQMVDHDLQLDGTDAAWVGSRDPGEWLAFDDDPTARSQWRHDGGDVVTLFAYPQGSLDDFGAFRSSLREEIRQQGVEIVAEDEDVPAPFTGSRLIGRGSTPEGDPLFIVHYFVLDREGRDIHHALASVVGDSADETEAMVREFLSHAQWRDAVEPRGGPSVGRTGPG
jgi:hypothetical protein